MPTCGSSWVCIPVTPGGKVTSRTRTRVFSRTTLAVLAVAPRACGETSAGLAARGLVRGEGGAARARGGFPRDALGSARVPPGSLRRDVGGAGRQRAAHESGGGGHK